MTPSFRFATLTAVVLALNPINAAHAVDVFKANGSNVDIVGHVDALRAAIGGVNHVGAVGPFADGRREVNWDAVPDDSADANFLAGDFFNAASGGRARGLVTSTPGAGFKASADNSNPTNTPILFGNEEFAPFSAQRIFSPIGSTETLVNFFVPGSPSTAATVSAFGVVFVGVDDAAGSFIQAFDAQGNQVGEVVSNFGDFGFVGLNFSDGTRIASVRINSGTQAIGGAFLDGGDTVAMDDFFYSEPLALAAAVPEPGTYALMLAGLCAVGGIARRRAAR